MDQDSTGFDIDVKCAVSGEKEKITIVFQKHEQYDPDYESDLIRYVKSSGILEPDDLVFKGGYIFLKGGGFCIDTPEFRDWEYKHMYISKRDKNDSGGGRE